MRGTVTRGRPMTEHLQKVKPQTSADAIGFRLPIENLQIVGRSSESHLMEVGRLFYYLSKVFCALFLVMFSVA